MLTQVKVVGVEHELGQIEELRDELLYVGHVVFGGREPGFTHAVEHPVGQVEMTSLEITPADRHMRPSAALLHNIPDVFSLCLNFFKIKPEV